MAKKELGAYKGRTIYEGENISKIISDMDKSSSSKTSSNSSTKNSTGGSNSQAMAEQAVKLGYVKSVDEYNNAVSEGQRGASQGYSSSGGVMTAKPKVIQPQTPNTAMVGYDPKSVSGFKTTYDNMKMKLDTNNNDAWTSRQQKKQTGTAIVNSFADQFAKNFKTQEEFTSAMQDPSMQKMLKDYEKAGGNMNDISGRITTPVTVTGETQNADGSYATQYSDGTTDNRRLQMNSDGTYTSTPAQSIDQYLGAINTPSQQKAFDALIPESKIAQDEIAFNQSIPEEYKQYYFGSEEQIGFLEQQKQQKQEEVKLLERKAKLDEKNARAQADYEIEKGRAEMDIADAEIQQNALNAKNYMTGMLAKLGALNTSSSAPQAIAGIDQKYQEQRQKLRTTYDMSNREMELKLTELVDNIGITRDEDILKIKSDLSKSEEDVWKEIFKLQNSADKETFNIISKYTKDFRSQSESYRKEAKADAKRYTNELQKTLSSYDLTGVSEGGYAFKKDAKGKVVGGGILDPEGKIRQVSDILESSKGPDGYVNSSKYTEMYNEFIKAGGTRSDFLKQFPRDDYVNPNDTSLPEFLRYKQPSQTLSTKSNREI